MIALGSLLSDCIFIRPKFVDCSPLVLDAEASPQARLFARGPQKAAVPTIRCLGLDDVERFYPIKVALSAHNAMEVPWALAEARFFGCSEFPFRSSFCWRCSGITSQRIDPEQD